MLFRSTIHKSGWRARQKTKGNESGISVIFPKNYASHKYSTVENATLTKSYICSFSDQIQIIIIIINFFFCFDESIHIVEYSIYIYIYLPTLPVSYGLQSSYLGTVSLPPPPSFFHHSFSGVIEQSECRVELSEGIKELCMLNLLAWLLLLRVRHGTDTYPKWRLDFFSTSRLLSRETNR